MSHKTSSAVTASSIGAILSLTTDDMNVVVPDGAGNIDLVGAHGINTSGAVANQASVQIDNAITLGDLSDIAAGSDALTIETGDITLSATNDVGNINIPQTHSSGNAGVIYIGSGTRIHAYNGSGGSSNFFAGNGAGNFTNTGSGGDSRNTGVGEAVLQYLTTGTHNSAFGHGSTIELTSGSFNTAVGMDSLKNCTSGSGNTAIGRQALFDNLTGTFNTAVGRQALDRLTSGSYNVAIGNGKDNPLSFSGPLGQLLTGSHNIAIGGFNGTDFTGAGASYTGSESSNICIGGQTTGTVGESNVMRLGTTGSGAGQINKCFIAGTHSITPAGGSIEMVVMDSNGQTGTQAIPTGLTWNEETGTSATMAVDNGYVANNAALVTLTLPATAAFGTKIRVAGKGDGGWAIAQNAGQTIIWDEAASTTTGVGGSLASTDDYDAVELLCITADTDWVVLSSKGNITVT
jgi:hypothetical protein